MFSIEKFRQLVYVNSINVIGLVQLFHYVRTVIKAVSLNSFHKFGIPVCNNIRREKFFNIQNIFGIFQSLFVAFSRQFKHISNVFFVSFQLIRILTNTNVHKRHIAIKIQAIFALVIRLWSKGEIHKSRHTCLFSIILNKGI